MRRATKQGPFLNPPKVKPGNWQGEILDGYTFSFGKVVQGGPPRRSVEFCYVVMPAVFTSPNPQYAWPGVVLVFAPTPMKSEISNAGLLLRWYSSRFLTSLAEPQYRCLMLTGADRGSCFPSSEGGKISGGRS